MLLEKGVMINNVNNNYGTALQVAIYIDNTNVIDVLLDPKRLYTVDVSTIGGCYSSAL